VPVVRPSVSFAETMNSFGCCVHAKSS